jgi:hypothetical protein
MTVSFIGVHLTGCGLQFSFEDAGRKHNAIAVSMLKPLKIRKHRKQPTPEYTTK